MAIHVNSVVTKYYNEKLAKTEAELATEKQKSKQTEAELAKTKAELAREKQNSKQLYSLKALAAGGVKLQPNKRARITLKMPNCAELFTNKEEFKIASLPITMAGFQWTLLAQRRKEPVKRQWQDLFRWPFDWLGLDLCLYPPDNYTGPFEFDVNWSFRVLSTFPDKDFSKQGTGKFKHGEPSCGWGFPRAIKIKKLLNPAKHFLQADGSILVEVHFTIKSATLDHFFVGC